MEVVQVCRVCLITDVNMYDLRTQPLQTYFEVIMGNSISTGELSSLVCFECAALVKKFYHFREKCLRGEVTLYHILQSTGKITKEEIQNISRSRFQLASKLSIHEIPIDSVINQVHDKDSILKIKKETVKEFKFKNQQFKFKNQQFKYESDFNNYSVPKDVDETQNTTENLPVDSHSSDDEDLLSLNMISKQKINSQYNVKEDAETKNATDVKTEICMELTDIVAVKTKSYLPKKYNAKKQKKAAYSSEGNHDDELVGDIEDYVTIVKLSVEEQIEEINKRQQSSNYLNAPYQCNICYKGFVYTHSWQHHVSKHDPISGDWECRICKIRFKTKCALYKHSTNHETKYVCDSCSYVSTSITQAKRHQRWHKGVTYKCQYCGDVSTKWTSYLSHVRIKHPSEFICNMCGCSFVSKLGLTLHKSRMHKDEENKIDATNEFEPDLYCKECDVKFISADALRRHMVASVKHKNISHGNGCQVCGKTFQCSEELRVHRREHSRKFLTYYNNKRTDTTWPINCEHCSEEILNGRHYWSHFRRAHPDKDYPVQRNHICHICGKCFQSNTFLVYHQRTHSKELAFKCPTCGKGFLNKANLQLHEKTHSEARPFPCALCHKAFKFKGALDRHSRCHTGVKPFECEVCGKAFTQSNSRKLHIRTVHMKQPAPPRLRQQLKNKP